MYWKGNAVHFWMERQMYRFEFLPKVLYINAIQNHSNYLHFSWVCTLWICAHFACSFASLELQLVHCGVSALLCHPSLSLSFFFFSFYIFHINSARFTNIILTSCDYKSTMPTLIYTIYFDWYIFLFSSRHSANPFM